jgi:hypothetical protein
MIIGISGKKQSGKDTAVNDILRRLEGARPVRVVRFADELKRIVSRCFDVTASQMEMEDGKNSKVWPSGKPVRELLQYLGTDVFRALDPDCWVNAYIHDVDELHNVILHETEQFPLILTPDVRFPNEVLAIQNFGGVVIRLTREPLSDEHESETALDGYQGFDAVLDNRDMTVEQQNDAMWNLICGKGWLDRD